MICAGSALLKEAHVTTSRRDILKMLPTAAAGLVMGAAAVNVQSAGTAAVPASMEFGGESLNSWEITLGDALYNRAGEAPVSQDDIETVHHLLPPGHSYTELLANVNRRVIMAHNITFYRIIKDTAFDFVHTCGFKFMLPYSPQQDTAAEYNGQTIEGGIFIWDGSKTKLDYGIAFQWVVNPWDKSGDINVWNGTDWPRVDNIDLATGTPFIWHEVRMVVNCPQKRTSLSIDGKSYPSQYTATKKTGFGPEVAARLQAEIVSIYPEPAGLKTLHKAHFKDWYWIWGPVAQLPAVLNPATVTLTPTATATPTPTPTATPVPTPRSCSEAFFTNPTSNQTVSRPFDVCWAPSKCAMVLQAYQNGSPQPIYENKRAVPCTRLGVGDIQPGLTELKIWVPGASTPTASIWITVL
jgi:hypothetical protein